MANQYWGKHFYDLVFQFNQSLEPFVSNFQSAKWGMHLWDLMATVDANISSFGGGNPAPPSGSLVYSVPTPANENDFSGLPGGVIPTGDQVYLADRDANTKWVISKSDTEWKTIPVDALP